MSGNPEARFEIVGANAKRLRDHHGWSIEVMDADPDGHVVGLSHGATTV